MAADRSRARILRIAVPVERSAPLRARLEKVCELVREDPRPTPPARSPRPHGRVARQVHDEHPARVDSERMRRFARELLQDAVHLGDAPEPDTVILVAPPRFLGYLRRETARVGGPRGPTFLEVPRELTDLETLSLQDVLEREGYLPPRARRGGNRSRI